MEFFNLSVRKLEDVFLIY